MRAVSFVYLAFFVVACSQPPDNGGLQNDASSTSDSNIQSVDNEDTRWSDAENEAKTLLVLTYNVAGLLEGMSGSHPEENIPKISPLLNSFDLVLVQEDFFYHQELVQDLILQYQSEPMSDNKDEFPISDGLNRASNFAFEPVARVQWPDCNGQTDCASDCMARKGFSYARTSLSSDVEVIVYNLHAEAGGCPGDIESRRAGYTLLASHIAENYADEALIVAGDYNLHKSDPEDLELLEDFKAATGLQSSCEYLSCGVDSIDKVLFRNSAELAFVPLSWENPGQFVDESGEDLSDHRPVAVRLRYLAEP